MGDLTVGDLGGVERVLAEDLVRLLLDAEPTGEEPLSGILEYAIEALTVSAVVPVIVPGKQVTWKVARADEQSTPPG